jgi:hypothetical protein
MSEQTVSLPNHDWKAVLSALTIAAITSGKEGSPMASFACLQIATQIETQLKDQGE